MTSDENPARLFDAFVCPDCRKPLSRVPPDCEVDAATFLRCAGCDTSFPIVNGVPKLWPPSRAAEIEASLAAFRGAHQAVRESRFFRALLPPNPICDPGARRRSARVKEAMARGLVLNLGAKDTAWGDHVINVDLVPPSSSLKSQASNLLVLADIQRLPFAAASVDGVICTNVLEHVGDARAALDEIARVVKPGGYAYITAPFIFPTHPDPLDRWRWTLDGLRHALRGFEELEAGVCGGPCSAFVSIVPTLKASVFSNFYLFNGVRCVAGWVLWPLKFLDHIACRSKKAHMAAAGHYFLGRKTAGTCP